MYIKPISIIEIFIHFLYDITMDFLRIILRIFIVSCLRVYFFLSCYCFYAFLLIFCKFLIRVLLVLMTVIHHRVLLFLILILILTKMLIAFKVIITSFQMIYG